MIKEQRKLKVLLVAFQCAPEGGSVSMIGWHWVKYLEPHVDLHLVTHIRHKLVLEQILPSSVTVTFVDTEWFSKPFYNMATRLFGSSQHLLFMVANIDFLYFSHKGMRELRPLHKERMFDICHVVTPVTPVAPHRFGTLGPPTLLGPLNGGLPFLKGFPEIGAEERAWLYRFRMLARVISRCYGTFRHAKVIFSATRSNDHELGEKLASKAYRMCENGVDEVAASVPPFPPLPPEAPLELLYVGRLIPIKGLRMLLDAIHGVLGVRLTLVGDGPLLQPLQEKVKAMGLEDRVSFLGYRKPEQLTEIYRQCHINVLPSVRESGGATILEAMAQGRPTLALNKGGPSEYITSSTGFLLDCHNTSQVTSDLRVVLKELREDPEVLVQMAEACLKRVRLHYTWTAKAAEILKVYRRVANNQEM